MKFSFEGLMKKGEEERKFAVEIEGKSKNDALQALYANLGASHRLKRSRIEIKKCEEIK